MKIKDIVAIYPHVVPRQDTRPRGGDELIANLTERINVLNPRTSHVADTLDDVTLILHQCRFSETALRALWSALKQSSYVKSAPSAQHLVWQQITTMVDEDLKGVIKDTICGLIYALRSEQSDEVHRGIGLTDWFFAVQLEYSDLSEYNRTWGESLRFALNNSCSIVPVEEKERILDILKTHSISLNLWKTDILTYAGNCRREVVSWLELYVDKTSVLRRDEQFCEAFRAKIAAKTASANSHSCSSKEDAHRVNDGGIRDGFKIGFY